MRLDSAFALAMRVRELLAPACEEIAIVGSIRRGKPEVKDIEILARPAAPQPVFGEPASAANALEALVARLVAYREIARHPEPAKRKDGPRWKTLWLPVERIAVDLFIADARGSNWGNQMAIRTGDYEFSRLLVTKRSAGGLMPRGLLHDEGYLYRLGKVLVPCPTEAAFFAALGIEEVPPPQQRNIRLVKQLRDLLRVEQVRQRAASGRRVVNV